MHQNEYDIFFYEAFEEEEELLKKYMPEHIKAGYSWETIQESGHEQPASNFISVRTQTVLPLEWAGQLKAVLSRSTGYNHLLAYQEKSGAEIDYGHLPLYCALSVAEQAMMYWMMLLRKMTKQTGQFNKFHRNGLSGQECAGKNILVAGVGNIGYEVVKTARGLGMNVKGVDIVKRHVDVDYCMIEDGLHSADIIVCAMNLTTKNAGYFHYDLLKQAKTGVIFINISRGELSPSQDLLRLLKEKHLGGLALDVYEAESDLAIALRGGTSSTNPAVKAVLEMSVMENVICTPHNAFNTAEAVERKAEQSARQAEAYLADGKFIWEIPEE